MAEVTRLLDAGRSGRRRKKDSAHNPVPVAG
jgi:hypothetical protein